MTEAATVFAIYRFRPDVPESAIADLLRRHRAVLVKNNLVTQKPPTVVRSLNPSPENRHFIEIFEWSDPNAPTQAHENPEVRSLWEELGTLTAQPQVSLRELAEAEYAFPHFAPFVVTYEAEETAGPDDADAPIPAADTKPEAPEAGSPAGMEGPVAATPPANAPPKRARRPRAPKRRAAKAKAPRKAPARPAPKRKAKGKTVKLAKLAAARRTASKPRGKTRAKPRR